MWLIILCCLSLACLVVWPWYFCVFVFTHVSFGAFYHLFLLIIKQLQNHHALMLHHPLHNLHSVSHIYHLILDKPIHHCLLIVSFVFHLPKLLRLELKIFKQSQHIFPCQMHDFMRKIDFVLVCSDHGITGGSVGIAWFASFMCLDKLSPRNIKQMSTCGLRVCL